MKIHSKSSDLLVWVVFAFSLIPIYNKQKKVFFQDAEFKLVEVVDPVK